jgi:hypothetical protein
MHSQQDASPRRQPSSLPSDFMFRHPRPLSSTDHPPRERFLQLDDTRASTTPPTTDTIDDDQTQDPGPG